MESKEFYQNEIKQAQKHLETMYEQYKTLADNIYNTEQILEEIIFEYQYNYPEGKEIE